MEVSTYACHPILLGRFGWTKCDPVSAVDTQSSLLGYNAVPCFCACYKMKAKV